MNSLDVMWVGIGGGIGSVLRWGVGKFTASYVHGAFPLGTFFVNVTGAFVIAYLSVAFGVAWHDRHGGVLAALVLTGILGGYTTFSSMQLDTLKLAQSGRGGLAFGYLVISVVSGLVAAAAGAALALV